MGCDRDICHGSHVCFGLTIATRMMMWFSLDGIICRMFVVWHWRWLAWAIWMTESKWEAEARTKTVKRQGFIAIHCIFHCFILFHIVWISQDIGDPCGLSMSHWSRSLHHFAFPWVVKMWNSSWISSQRDSAGVGSGSCALNSSWILGPYPPTVIVSWQILSCCTETFLQHLESGATGIIRTWPKRNCQRSSANFDDLIRTQ